MGFARDIMRATLRTRREQEKRNAAAMAEEAERLEAIPEPSGGSYRPREGRKMLRQAAPENKVLESAGAAPEAEAPQGTGNPLDAIPWASPQAYGKAMGFGLSASAFAGQEYTGRSGFTSADVSRIAAEVPGE